MVDETQNLYIVFDSHEAVNDFFKELLTYYKEKVKGILKEEITKNQLEKELESFIIRVSKILLKLLDREMEFKKIEERGLIFVPVKELSKGSMFLFRLASTVYRMLESKLSPYHKGVLMEKLDFLMEINLEKKERLTAEEVLNVARKTRYIGLVKRDINGYVIIEDNGVSRYI